MRIAVLCPPWIRVPPAGYGGIEWVVHMLTEELASRGHDVTLFATGDSITAAKLRFVFETGPTARMHETRADAMHAGSAFRYIVEEARQGRPFHVVHDHTAWLGLAFARTIETPVVHTVHGAFIPDNREFYRHFADHATFVTISAYQQRDFPEIPYAAVVPNAVDVATFPYRRDKQDYLLCLGRVARDKGQAIAVQAALEAGRPLVIAGKVEPGGDSAYFEESVLPFVDGDRIRFEGEVPDARKRELLSGAAGLLMPVQWPEPFGLVMIEALACGTPVVAIPNGSVPEIVTERVGFLVQDGPEMVKAIARLDEIDPRDCRDHVERFFSPAVMTDGYERVYERVARA